MINRICIRELKRQPRKRKRKDMTTKDDKDALFRETVFMLFALDIAAKLVIYGTAAFLILK